jgi:heat shock protein HtpX
MPAYTSTIAPRRSVALFALLATFMVALSYLVLLFVAAACVYLPFLAITNIETMRFQVLALQLGGIAVAVVILWSLFPRFDKFEAPGLLLEREAHPRLFAELDSIAVALNEPLPREVYLVGQPNAFVADRGGILGIGSRRVMGIGLPLLSALSVSEMRAVLAHEFAHYYSGDTSMGPWVYNSQSAMIRTFQNMGSLRQFGRIAIFQLLCLAVFSVLKWYFIFFLKVTNFVSRRKEYRADELACLVAGSEAMVQGLRKIHGAALAWAPYWNTEVVPALSEKCIPAIGDGFARFLAAPEVAPQVEQGIEKEIAEGEAEPYDTHPPLRDRIAAVEKLGAVDHEEQDGAIALSLLDEPLRVELKLVTQMNPGLEAASLKQVGWDEIGPRVLIPAWRQRLSEYAKLVAGFSGSEMPLAAKMLPGIGSQMQDPKGVLLDARQRTERAGHLFATSLALAMVENGWELHAQPGSLSLVRDGKEINVIAKTHELFSGRMSEADWGKLCADLGIGELSLTKAVEAAPQPQVSAP